MTIDFHMHLFPDFLAERTLAHLREVSHAETFTDGTVAGTLASMAANKISHGVVNHIATKPAQQRKVNDFAAQVQRENVTLSCFGSVHPAAPDALEELLRIKELGLRGVKLHPDYQDFFFGEECYYPLYEAIAKLELPLTIHAGWDPISPKAVHAPPADIARVARELPSLTLIAAHMGGMRCYAQSLSVYQELPNFYVDTSMSGLLLEDPVLFEALIRKIGVSHVLFATDSPWDTPERERALLEATHLTDSEKRAIYGENAKRLLHL